MQETKANETKASSSCLVSYLTS